jgi:hypothetical protein
VLPANDEPPGVKAILPMSVKLQVLNVCLLKLPMFTAELFHKNERLLGLELVFCDNAMSRMKQNPNIFISMTPVILFYH